MHSHLSRKDNSASGRGSIERIFMKLNFSRPPLSGKDPNERLDRLTSWLTVFSEELSVVLSNLSEDNFTKGARERIFAKGEDTDDNL